jgi:lysophospholipase L1-like esterase
VVRKAASGTRILRQYDCITYESYGLQGKTRFPHEFPVTGADTLIIQQGINDIIHPVGTNINPFRPMSDLPTATELIDGLKWYIEQAKKQNLTVYIGTLLPIYGWRTYASFREELKNEINDWIRNNDCADGFIDFDKAVRDAKHKEAFAVGFDSGDHLHPSFAAYEAMANAVPEELLK